jgi:PAS domain S-box-containing protein
MTDGPGPGRADKGDARLRAIYAATNMTIQEIANAELQQAQVRAEVLWQRAPIGLIEATPEGVITSVNEALAAMLGYRTEDFVGKLVEELAEPTYAAAIKASVKTLLLGQGYTAERRYSSSDGRSVPVYVSTAVIHDEKGAVCRLAAFVVDMSELHAQRAALSAALADVAAARDELARRQSFADALLQTVEVGIVSCDADGGSRVRNRAERAMLGIPEPPVGSDPELSDPAIDFLDAGGKRLDPRDYPLTRALRGETLGNVDFQVGPVGGPHHDVVIRGSQITTPDGVLAGAVVVVTDVTAERSASRELHLERGRLHEAQRLGQLGSFTYDLATGQFTFSEQIYRIWGVPQDAELASLQTQMIHPEDQQRVAHEWDVARVVGGQHAIEHRIVRPDGSVRHLRVALEVLLDAVGGALVVQGTHLDVTDLTLAQRQAVEASTLFQAILTATPDYTVVTEVRTGAVVYGSPGKTILGLSSVQLQQVGPSILAALVHPEEQRCVEAVNLAAGDLADGEALQVRYRARHTDGSWHWLSRRVTPFRRDESSGRVLEVLGVVRDVTDVIEAEERLAYTALHDPLTGLPNRALLMDRLDAALARADQNQRDVAILFCDLDGFKRVNDAAGHAAGDIVLIETASRLKAVLREHDTVARIGGDEFVIIVEPWKRSDAELITEPRGADGHDQTLDDRALVAKLADRITNALRQPITINNVEHVVTVSIGITYTTRPDGDTGAAPTTADAVLQDADAAMYRAKNRGKDRFEVFEHELRTDLAERGRVEHVLRRALSAVGKVTATSDAETGRSAPWPTLTAAYQPIVNVRTGALVGFEALARLTDPEGLPIPPDIFIDVAEHTALIGPLGAVMLELACAQLATWRRELPALEHVTMAVNISALQAQHSSLGDDVRHILHQHGLAPRDLVLELTETALLQATSSTLTALGQLRDDGVGIAIDDFGIGYASLRYLATLPVTTVKVDRSFTAGLPHDETSCKIVSAVVGLAADLHLACVVEGVETEEQRRALPDGVHIQGWLTGPPATAKDIDVLRLVLTGV